MGCGGWGHPNVPVQGREGTRTPAVSPNQGHALAAGLRTAQHGALVLLLLLGGIFRAQQQRPAQGYPPQPRSGSPTMRGRIGPPIRWVQGTPPRSSRTPTLSPSPNDKQGHGGQDQSWEPEVIPITGQSPSWRG